MKKCFSITDLFVTLALVAVIVSIGAPIVLAARKKARITACATQQRELYLYAANFAGDRGRLPQYGDGTTVTYFDVLEGQRVDGEFGRFLHDYVGTDTVAESGVADDGEAQLALGDWSTTLLNCPAASAQSKWWYEKYHHAMGPWETIGYRFAGLDVLAGAESPFGPRQLGRMEDPTAVVFLQDNALSAEAQRMSPIFGDARENNHQYGGLNVLYADGRAEWTLMHRTTILKSLGDRAGGYYRTSQPVDGQMQWWRGELHVLPTDAYNVAPGMQVFRPDNRVGMGKAMRVSVYATVAAREAKAEQLAIDAAMLGYSLRGEADDTDARRRRGFGD